jgi:hypothetical protein
VVQRSLSTRGTSPHEAAWLWPTMHVISTNVEQDYFEPAVARAGFLVEQTARVGSEWPEYHEESRWDPCRR